MNLLFTSLCPYSMFCIIHVHTIQGASSLRSLTPLPLCLALQSESERDATVHVYLHFSAHALRERFHWKGSYIA